LEIKYRCDEPKDYLWFVFQQMVMQIAKDYCPYCNGLQRSEYSLGDALKEEPLPQIIVHGNMAVVVSMDLSLSETHKETSSEKDLKFPIR
jgi:hypothetical protein